MVVGGGEEERIEDDDVRYPDCTRIVTGQGPGIWFLATTTRKYLPINLAQFLSFYYGATFPRKKKKKRRVLARRRGESELAGREAVLCVRPKGPKDRGRKNIFMTVRVQKTEESREDKKNKERHKILFSQKK